MEKFKNFIKENLLKEAPYSGEPPQEVIDILYKFWTKINKKTVEELEEDFDEAICEFLETHKSKKQRIIVGEFYMGEGNYEDLGIWGESPIYLYDEIYKKLNKIKHKSSSKEDLERAADIVYEWYEQELVSPEFIRDMTPVEFKLDLDEALWVGDPSHDIFFVGRFVYGPNSDLYSKEEENAFFNSQEDEEEDDDNFDYHGEW